MAKTAAAEEDPAAAETKFEYKYKSIDEVLAPREPDPYSKADCKFAWGCMNGHLEQCKYWHEQGADINLMQHVTHALALLHRFKLVAAGSSANT